MIKKILLKLITFYKSTISPNTKRSCRFTPSCSEYAYETLNTHSTFKSILLISKRVISCNPVGPYGYDPVKDKK